MGLFLLLLGWVILNRKRDRDMPFYVKSQALNPKLFLVTEEHHSNNSRAGLLKAVLPHARRKKIVWFHALGSGALGF